MPFVAVQESKAGLNGAEREGTVSCGMGGGHRQSRLGCCESWLYLEREAYLFIFFFLGILTGFLSSLWVAGKDSPVSLSVLLFSPAEEGQGIRIPGYFCQLEGTAFPPGSSATSRTRTPHGRVITGSNPPGRTTHLRFPLLVAYLTWLQM